ncbi:phosphatase PAP2 family protein [Allosalinactinospora lopnorensis]|uniref:phosphatase PAP2 family protein n=1 Tax=Allosalinactinospora lopnorensis TaxID=1352348 RepID=UPI000696FD32|nr:phosphatase PAP2 family protein [Allosalinactinospora lopnorensis]
MDRNDPAHHERDRAAPGPLPAQRRVLAVVMTVAAVPLVTLWALVSAQWGPVVSLDRAIAVSLYEFVLPAPDLAHGVELWSETFGTWSMRIVSLLAACWLLLRRQFSTAAWAAATVFLANLFGLILKLTVDRPRPGFAEPLATGVGPSFPSGHALMAATGMGILLFATLPLLRDRFHPIAWTVATAIALSTALSRPLLAVHWVSDIAAGLALGVFTLAATMLLWTFLPPIARRWDRPSRGPSPGA